MTSLEIELAVTRCIGIRQHMIVPNVFWGMGFAHELDLLVLSPSGYAYEIEIKTSKADLKRDKLKRKWKRGYYENSKLIRGIYFAIPEELKDCITEIPERAGVYIVGRNERGNGTHCDLFRKAKTNSNARKFTEKEQAKLGRLAAMRIWTLKETLHGHIKEAKT